MSLFNSPTLFQCPAFRTLCTLIFSSFFHQTQSKLNSLRPWSRKVNTLQLELGKQKNYAESRENKLNYFLLAEYKSSLDYFYLPLPCTPYPLPPPTKCVFMFDPRPKEISTKAWLLSHVCYFKMEGSIDRKQRGIPKLRDLLRRQRRESEVIV